MNHPNVAHTASASNPNRSITSTVTTLTVVCTMISIHPPAASSGSVAAPKAARVHAPKMNFADAHALKILPEKIAEAEIKMAELEQRLSDSGLYARDAALFAKLSEELAKIRAQKDSDEERWLTLEMEREALEEAGEGEQPS